MVNDSSIKSSNPYLGPIPFPREKRALFFSRNEEAQDLFYLTLANQLVLFYAQSGAGKSSLINTKLIPDLEGYGFKVFPVGRVGGSVEVEDPDLMVNPFTYNLMEGILLRSKTRIDEKIKPDITTRRTLSDFFSCLIFENETDFNFDIDLFLSKNNRNGILRNDSNRITRKALIIDQFEEFLTTNAVYWKKREEFFDQLNLLIENDPGIHVVLVAREEFVPGLGPYTTKLPGGMRHRFYMQLLDRQGATEAITEPVKGLCEYSPTASAKLVKNLLQIIIPGTGKSYEGEFIDPVQLQIVCFHLWEKIKDRQVYEITEELVEQEGNIQSALENFYDESIKYVMGERSIEEKLLRDWFEKKLITENGIRNIVRQEFESTAGLSNEVAHLLEKRYILRPVFHVGVETMFELAHDRLIQPIRQSNQKWALAHPDKNELPKFIKDNLHLLKETRKGTQISTDRIIKIPVFIKEPYLALENPSLGVQEISVRLEEGMRDGPTSSRVAVVDYDADTQTMAEPVIWDQEVGWFRAPGPNGEWLPYAFETSTSGKIERAFIEKLIRNPYYRQVNAWAVAQRVLEFYEAPEALGRPVPWGSDGHRLTVVPHAGYQENAFYDRESKSLQLFYFGDREAPKYTCLSHDVIAHETGIAIMDGIRPMNMQAASRQSDAFFYFIGDLTAILLALYNEGTCQFIAEKTDGKLVEADILTHIAPEIGQEITGKPYLRTPINQLTMQTVQSSTSSITASLLLTGAMWDILTGLVAWRTEHAHEITLAQALGWAAEQLRRIALQPLDLCPPCDIQFIDYAKAVIRNDILTNPMDEQRFRPLILEVFHRRGLCDCGYKPGRDLPEGCLFKDVIRFEKMDLINHDIERVSRSRTEAYYFLNDNRQLLRIPAHQDVRVVDLYDINKIDAAGKWLRRETVLEYAWQEEVTLVNDPHHNLDFGQMNGKTVNLDCGGTLVFDDLGNLLSWFRKPGTEHVTPGEEEYIRRRLAAWQVNPVVAREQKNRKPSRLEIAELTDLEIGQQRKAALLAYKAMLT